MRHDLVSSPQDGTTVTGERTASDRKASVAACGRRRTGRVKDTRALNAHKALCAAPISMGRGWTPVELCQQPSVFASFIAYQLANNERGQSMQEDRTFENKFAPPVRSEKKIGNTTFTVNSFFLEQTKDGVVSKIERLIKDDIRKKAAVI